MSHVPPGGWKRRFEDPIQLDDGTELATLEDAGNHIMGLPQAEQLEERWQTAAAELLMSAEKGGIIMLARIAMMQAINAKKAPTVRNGQVGARKKSARKHRIIR